MKTFEQDYLNKVKSELRKEFPFSVTKITKNKKKYTRKIKHKLKTI